MTGRSPLQGRSSRAAIRGVALFCVAVAGVPGLAVAASTGAHRAPAGPHFDVRTSVPSKALLAAIVRATAVIPSFSRQTNLPCSACHYQFPQLTPFGRLFKLNGYTLTGLATIAGGDSARPSLKLAPIPPASAMVVASLAHVGAALPAAQNNSAMFPEQASLFLGGQVTPRVGAFVQLTYAAQDGFVAIDNVDVRYAGHGTWLDRNVLFGATLHNNPTVQDVWNTVPAWGYPFMSSSITPSPIAATLLEGALGQQVMGLGGYALWDDLLYAELTAYRSAQQGTRAPLDSGSTNVISDLIPYGRLALQHDGQSTYLMVGGFGVANARLYPHGVTGPTNAYTTLGVDAQLEQRLGEGGAMLIGRAIYLHESQRLDASFAADEAEHERATVESFRANLSYLPSTFLSTTLGYFATTGSADTLRYAPGELTGSRTGSPDTDGFIAELSLNPWQNTRAGLQYVAYRRFNGERDAYDLPGGRHASDNNTLYLYTWIAF